MKSPFEIILEQIKNNTLTTIKLWYNQIDDTGAQALAEALKVNKTLTSIDLGGNEIGDAGAKDLAEALKVHKTLTSIDLGGNQIGAAGAKDLAEALKENKTLTSINLIENRIGDTGAQALAEALKENKTLTSINLIENRIGDTGAQALAEALKVNKTLTSISLKDNWWIGATGAKDLDEALKENYTLLEIKRECNSEIPTYLECNSEIPTYLERNKAIASCLEPLHTFIVSPDKVLDGKTISESIEALERLVPNLDALEDEAYPSEAYRLLTALGHLTTPTDSLSLHAEAKSPQKDALACLLPPFAHPPFQKIADVALGHLLSGDLKRCFKPTSDAERARSILVLHALREQLHKSEVMHFAYTALYELLYPDASVSVSWREDLINCTALLSYQTLCNLISDCLG